MKTIFMTYSKSKFIRVKTKLLVVLSFLLLTNCNNSPITEQWDSIKDEKRLDMIVLFASQNLNNSFCDSAITFLSDTSLHLMSSGMVLKDSINFMRNSVIVYPDYEYDCISALPPYLDRVAFRIHIKGNDTIIINEKSIKFEELKMEIETFILNENNLDSLPPKRIIKYDDKWGEIETTQAVVEIYCDIYGEGNIQENLMKTFKVFKIIFVTYDSIRKKKSKEIFGSNFDKLSSQQKDIIRTMNPLRLYLKPNVFLHYYPYFFNPPPALSTEDLIIFDSTLKNEE